MGPEGRANMAQGTWENSTWSQTVRSWSASDSLPHAVVISGTGPRLDAARFLAAAMECRAPQGRPCLTCSQCRKVLSGIHPDVLTVSAQDTRELTVKAVRELRSELYIFPNDAPRKIALFPDAAQLNERDQNVLLKIVEEGPPYAAFLFCVENSALLLPTIRSRCVELKVQQEEPWPEADPGLIRAFAAARRGAVTAYLTELENRRPKREELQQQLRHAWRICAQALLMQSGGAADPAMGDEPGLLSRSLNRRQLAALTELLHRYAAECDYNVGVGHVLGALAAEWEKLV